ncbi:hypothetical protein MARPO_0094s0077 [Marchantia polymorpha]|uniref:Uncharacterized protein n=1 Tax=Marchantia polymorpha TaxID=3197 RepID=A0A2R6WGD0_MARPO|nr:hypothetical protein MARPO_0094s0077 [Marchantia polymorpha]|eukprot:PTQ32910.1 hypothetical protein MARPO_0094s0077 [Marchantia polymorpha]
MEAVTSREVYRRNMSEEFSSFLCAANSDFVSTDLCKLVTGRRQSTGQQGRASRDTAHVLRSIDCVPAMLKIREECGQD